MQIRIKSVTVLAMALLLPLVRVSTVIDGHIFRLIDGRWGAFTLHGPMVPSLSVAVKTAFGARFTRGLDSAPQRSILVTMQSETLVIRDTVMKLN